MTEGPAGSRSTEPAAGGGSSRWVWLLPALTFLVGVALGAAVVAAGSDGSGDGQDAAVQPTTTASPEPSPETSPTPTGSPDTAGTVVVRVPRSCLEAADRADAAVRQLDDVAIAARELDARRLQELVNQLQAVRPEVQQLAEQCRDRGDAEFIEEDVPGATARPTP